jgi:23S rRNA pseudouridine1911/1915/1917 synthase
LVIVNKPFGLAIHPTANDLYRTLTHWLRLKYEDEPVHPCHRIDRDTSGLVVCARNKSSGQIIKAQFAAKKIFKQYLAVCDGQLREKIKIIIPLALQGDKGLVRIKMIPQEDGSNAETLIAPHYYDQNFNRTLVICQPFTGRQHQIRAHMWICGYPIIGDKLYQMGEKFFDRYTKSKGMHGNDLLPHFRHALHAHKISFNLKNKTYNFTAPIPKDFHQIIEIPQHLSLDKTFLQGN